MYRLVFLLGVSSCLSIINTAPPQHAWIRTLSPRPPRRASQCCVTRVRRGVTMAIDPSGLWDSYLGALESNPLLTKAVTAGILLPAADLAAQVIEKSKASAPAQQPAGGLSEQQQQQPLDLARTARFATFGFVLQAPWNHFYYLFLDQLIPPSPDPLSVTTASKVVIDQFVQAPIFTVIIFAFLGLLEGKSTGDITDKLSKDYWGTMSANWRLWVPATMVNMAFIPPVLRVGFVNLVFFGWSVFLSLVVNSKDATTDTEYKNKK